jgi:branched-chain amino acid aminotransferase
VPWREATTHVLTHSLHYGMGVFEGVRAYKTERGTAIFRLEGTYRAPVPFGPHFPDADALRQGDLNEAQKEVIRANNLESGYLRPLAFYGSEKMGVSPRAPRCTSPSPPGLGAPTSGEKASSAASASRVVLHPPPREHLDGARQGVRQLHELDPGQQRSATNEGYDEAMLLDPEGYVCEGAGENLFIVKNGKLYTPDLTACLEGITRATVHAAGRANWASVQEKRITRDEVYCCRRSLLHRHRRRSDADPRTRQPPDRHRPPRPDHQAAAGQVFRRGQWPLRRSTTTGWPYV